CLRICGGGRGRSRRLPGVRRLARSGRSGRGLRRSGTPTSWRGRWTRGGAEMLPDSTALVVEFLADRMDVPVSSLVPRGRDALESPARLITVTRTGGPALNRAVDK